MYRRAGRFIGQGDLKLSAMAIAMQYIEPPAVPAHQISDDFKTQARAVGFARAANMRRQQCASILGGQTGPAIADTNDAGLISAGSANADLLQPVLAFHCLNSVQGQIIQNTEHQSALGHHINITQAIIDQMHMAARVMQAHKI